MFLWVCRLGVFVDGVVWVLGFGCFFGDLLGVLLILEFYGEIEGLIKACFGGGSGYLVFWALRTSIF